MKSDREGHTLIGSSSADRTLSEGWLHAMIRLSDLDLDGILETEKREVHYGIRSALDNFVLTLKDKITFIHGPKL